jgi:hypothetical protein
MHLATHDLVPCIILTCYPMEVVNCQCFLTSALDSNTHRVIVCISFHFTSPVDTLLPHWDIPPHCISRSTVLLALDSLFDRPITGLEPHRYHLCKICSLLMKFTLSYGVLLTHTPSNSTLLSCNNQLADCQSLLLLALVASLDTLESSFVSLSKRSQTSRTLCRLRCRLEHLYNELVLCTRSPCVLPLVLPVHSLRSIDSHACT